MKAIAWIFGIVCLIIIIIVSIQELPSFSVVHYEAPVAATLASSSSPVFVVTHIKTPPQVKAIYMTSYVAGNGPLRDNLVKIIDETEINAVVIDIKDYTGEISYKHRVPDMKEFIGRLHDKGIYVIGRLSSFQDSHMVATHPELAVKTMSGSVWKDRKGISWIDASAKPMWEYLIGIAKESYALGFDEINFDYIRFPSDGNMKDIKFPFSEGKSKSIALRDFFRYIKENMQGIPISADLFGMTTTNKDDLGIGQVLEYALENFDYVAPMVYPSHYPKNFHGYENPNKKPYEVVNFAMKGGIEKINVMNVTTASSSPISIKKLRPWLQDFSIYGVTYGPKEVSDQMRAIYDIGLDSYMLWNASNRYTVGGLLSPEKTFATSTIQ